MGSLWGAVYILRKYPICEQLSTGKTRKPPNKTKKTPPRRRNSVTKMLLRFFSALVPERCLCGWCCLVGLAGVRGGRGSSWCGSSCRRPLYSKYQVRAITKGGRGFVLNEERRRLCCIVLVCFEKSFRWLVGFTGLHSFCLNSYKLF